MARRIAAAMVLIGLGAAVGMWLSSGRRVAGDPAANASHSGAPVPEPGIGAVGAADASAGRAWARPLERLAARIEEEAAARQALERRLDAVAAQLAAREAGAPAGAEQSAAAAVPGRNAADGVAAPAAAESEANATQRALIAAGVDAATAAEITRRADEMTMAEMYLRDQAAREQWLDTPRFAEAMEALEQQRVSVRDEIGDEAYDRYLFALGEFNRVRVDDVLTDSPAAQAGLRRGDIVLRYGEARLFAPGELVAKTRAGTAGESVRLEVVRDGQRLEVEVPRGPLGLRIAAAKHDPGAS